MASKFTALALTKGEAFLLETMVGGKPFTVLVDSGNRKGSKTRHPLVDAISHQAGTIDRIDVAICTHKDADHSSGFANFADHWLRDGGEIGEFWLPGRWATIFPLALFHPDVFFETLMAGADRLGEFRREHRTQADRDEHLSGLLRELRTGPLETYNAGRDRAERHHDERSIEQRLADALGVDPNDIGGYETPDWLDEEQIERLPSPSWHWLDPFFLNIFHQLIQKAKEIARIADCAVRNRIPIRWFDYDAYSAAGFASGGEPNLLVPLNARELVKPPVPPDASLQFALHMAFSLELSPQNVASLVFIRPESSEEPAALFLGDSRLAEGIRRPTTDFQLDASLAPKRRFIATAPHHGSRVNDHAYGVLKIWSSATAVFVRNGGMWNQTPEEFYEQQERGCVRCWTCATRRDASRPVVVNSTGANWTWPSGKWCARP